MTIRRFVFRMHFFLCLCLASALPLCAQDWKPIDPAQLALKAPTIDKEADAEGLFWEIKIQDETGGVNEGVQRALYHYARIKIFTERGVEKHGKSRFDLFRFWPQCEHQRHRGAHDQT